MTNILYDAIEHQIVMIHFCCATFAMNYNRNTDRYEIRGESNRTLYYNGNTQYYCFHCGHQITIKDVRKEFLKDIEKYRNDV